MVDGGGSGSFKDVSYFTCSEGHGLFLPLSRLRRDTRFYEGDDSETSSSEPSVTSKTSQQGGESASATNTQDPLGDILSKLMGDSKGSLHCSCYF